jgi:acyl carrier protein
MLSRKEIQDKLKEVLLNADPQKKDILPSITDSSSLNVDLGLTSVGMLFLVIVMEETFGVTFDDAGLGDFKTFGDIVDFIEKNQKD